MHKSSKKFKMYFTEIKLFSKSIYFTCIKFKNTCKRKAKKVQTNKINTDFSEIKRKKLLD